jgi:hypothetical protein
MLPKPNVFSCAACGKLVNDPKHRECGHNTAAVYAFVSATATGEAKVAS